MRRGGSQRPSGDATLIRLLADGEFHSGQMLAERLGMTRAAVWKALRRACDRLGLSLESTRGKGYRLQAPIELLDPERILASVSPRGRRVIARLEIHEQIDSTNRHLMREASAGAPSGTVCLAERQTAGRGRLGRPWISPFGANLYLSVLWRYAAPPAALGGFSLVAGAVVADVLRRAGVQGLALKWPNDLLWRRRKLGGILLEVAGEAQGPCALVAGVGINLRMAPDQGLTIDQPWVDLSEVIGGAGPGRNRIAAQVIDALLDALDRFDREGLEPFLDLWNEFDLFRGESAQLLVGDRVVRGVVIGIAADGALRLETAEGERVYHAGEVSLRSEALNAP
jgi:BirA family transcriptional regulator, biotin operon repressor / biotin---[acetyl-CoA-carboxylase] ligase